MKQDSNRAGPYFSIPHVYKTFHDEITILLRWQLVSQLPVCEKKATRRFAYKLRHNQSSFSTLAFLTRASKAKKG